MRGQGDRSHVLWLCRRQRRATLWIIAAPRRRPNRPSSLGQHFLVIGRHFLVGQPHRPCLPRINIYPHRSALRPGRTAHRLGSSGYLDLQKRRAGLTLTLPLTLSQEFKWALEIKQSSKLCTRYRQAGCTPNLRGKPDPLCELSLLCEPNLRCQPTLSLHQP